MRTPSNLNRPGFGFNMTPMIDVSFLLIVFFLVSSHLAQQEVQLELELPGAQTGQPPWEQSEQTRRLIVNVLPQGSLFAGGRTLDVPALEKMIALERALAEADFEVRIRSDRSAPYRTVEPVLLACVRAGVWNVSFSVVAQRAD